MVIGFMATLLVANHNILDKLWNVWAPSGGGPYARATVPIAKDGPVWMGTGVFFCPKYFTNKKGQLAPSIERRPRENKLYLLGTT